MRTVISVRDLEEMLRNGKDVRALPDDAILTPSARDFSARRAAQWRIEECDIVGENFNRN
jgi:ethanolamine utilization cobalamin adenosyltransferase